jgi:hypothetical protein
MWSANALKGASSIAVAPHYEYRPVAGLNPCHFRFPSQSLSLLYIVLERRRHEQIVDPNNYFLIAVDNLGFVTTLGRSEPRG